MRIEPRARASRALLAMVAVVAVGVVAVPAQDAPPFEVDAVLEPDTGITDTQPIRLVIRISGAGQPDVRAPRLPAFDNLRVVNGPFQSSNFRWVNGRSSANVTLTYTLLALRPGPAEVPPIEVRVGGRVYTTETIRVEVAKGQTAPPPSASPPGRSGVRPRDRGTGAASTEADVYLRARLSSTAVWTGQPVSLEVELLDGVGVSNLDWVSTPSFSDFWVEDGDVRPEAEAYLESVGERRYRVYPLVRKMLIPTRSGSFALDPFTVRLNVPVSTGDPFTDLFRSRSTQVVRKTDPLSIEVKPLPEEGRPPGFAGAVGTFRMRHELDRAEATVDEAVALRVSIEGDGFLKSAPTPALASSPQIRVFEPKESQVARIDDGRLVSRKNWEWVLVPLSSGEVDLPEITFPYFDVESERYVVLRTEPMRIAVTGAGGRSSGSSGTLQAERRDIEYIKTRFGALRERTPPFHRTALFHVLLAGPFAVVPVLVAAGRRRSRLRNDRGLVRARRARSRARKRLASVEKRERGLDGATYHEEIARALVDYVADRFDRSAAGLTYDVADGLLARGGVSEDLRAAFRKCLETCDFARFVPSSDGVERRHELLQEARSLVDRLESER